MATQETCFHLTASEFLSSPKCVGVSSGTEPHTSRLCSVVVSNDGKYIYTGSPDSCSFIRVWENCESSVKLVCIMGPMVGATRWVSLGHIVNDSLDGEIENNYQSDNYLAPSLLAVVTSIGWLYVWDVNPEILNEYKSVSLLDDPKLPILVLESQDNPTGPLSFAAFLQDQTTLICAGQLPSYNLSLINGNTGTLLCTIPPLCANENNPATTSSWERRDSIPVLAASQTRQKKKFTMWNYTCIQVDPISSSTIVEHVFAPISSTNNLTDIKKTRQLASGHWVALGDMFGCLGTFFIPDQLLNGLKAFMGTPCRLSHPQISASVHKLCEMSVPVLDLTFRPRPKQSSQSRSPTISLAAADGFIRHWNIEKNILQFAKGSVGQGSAETRFLCYGPLDKKPHDATCGEAHPVLIVAINTLFNGLGSTQYSLNGVSDTHQTVEQVMNCNKGEEYTDTPHIRCWSVLPSPQPNPRRSHCIKTFTATITGFAQNQYNNIFVTVSIDGTIVVHSAVSSNDQDTRGNVIIT